MIQYQWNLVLMRCVEKRTNLTRAYFILTCGRSPRCSRPASNADPYVVTGKIFATITEDVEVPEIKAKNRDQA